MNTTLKSTILAMATTALGFAAGCGNKAEHPAATPTTGGETAAPGQASCQAGRCQAGHCVGAPGGATSGQHSCSGTTGGTTGAGNCGGQNSCGAANPPATR